MRIHGVKTLTALQDKVFCILESADDAVGSIYMVKIALTGIEQVAISYTGDHVFDNFKIYAQNDNQFFI